MTKEERQKLRELEQKATPGPSVGCPRRAGEEAVSHADGILGSDSIHLIELLQSELAEARAEVARLRAEFSRLSDLECTTFEVEYGYPRRTCENSGSTLCVCCAARAALQPGPDGEER